MLAFVDATGDLPPFANGAGYDLGKTMIAAGLATVYQFDNRFARQGQYESAEDTASAAQLGSWSPTTCGGNFHSNAG